MHGEHLGGGSEAYLVAGGLNDVEYAAEVMLKAKAFRRRVDRTVAPDKESAAEIVLQLADLVADCRLCEVQLFGCTCEAVQAGRRFECPK